jgi:hypothetical protein
MTWRSECPSWIIEADRPTRRTQWDRILKETVKLLGIGGVRVSRQDERWVTGEIRVRPHHITRGQRLRHVAYPRVGTFH